MIISDRAKPLRALGLIAFAFVLALSPVWKASAIEAFPYAGYVDVTPVSGCCEHLTPSAGYGLIIRAPKIHKDLGDLEVSAYSDFRFTDATVSKYFHLIGSNPQIDPSSNKEITVTRYSLLNVTLSYGFGIFTHNTYTTDYHLPILVTGVEGLSRLTTSYTLSDIWSIFILFSLSVGYSAVELDTNLGYAAGISFRF